MTAPVFDLDVVIWGASFFSTHFASAGNALMGTERAFTAPKFELLTGRARRFTSLATQLHIEACGALPASSAGRPSVFATCHGEIQTAHRLIGEFRDAGEVSSAHFAHSVHNTPSGLYSVATGNTAPSSTITGANAVAAAWLEAALVGRETDGPVILSIADEPVPEAFDGLGEPAGVAAAFLVGPAAPSAGGGVPARLSMEEGGQPPERTLSLLAHIVDLVIARATGSVKLGSIQPGASLRLHVTPAGTAP